MTVGVGSFSDPPEIQGLAHFLEHMIFMGSEKYPKVLVTFKALLWISHSILEFVLYSYKCYLERQTE